MRFCLRSVAASAASAARRPCGGAAALSAAALLVACGGGSGDFAFGDVRTENVQGWAADAATAPPAAAAAADNATLALEAAMRSGPVPVGDADDARALSAARPLLTVASVPCAGGGSIRWTVTGSGGSAKLLDDRLDAGETFEIVYAACGDPVAGMQLDGRASLAVAANSDTATDWTFTATALQATSAQGRDLLDGSMRQRRSISLLPAGGTQTRVALTSPAFVMASQVGNRVSTFELRALDWTVTRNADASGAFGSRSHAGTLTLVSTTTRRPKATLQITAQGTVVAGGGRYASQGALTLVTGDGDRVAIEYGPASATLTLDIGNDGRGDRSWTIPRREFDEEAG